MFEILLIEGADWVDFEKPRTHHLKFKKKFMIFDCKIFNLKYEENESNYILEYFFLQNTLAIKIKY